MATHRLEVLLKTVAGILCICLLLAQQLPAQEDSEHSRVGNPKYWTSDCFLMCYKSYLRCVARVLPPKALNNEEIVVLFKNKSTNYHRMVEDCSAKYESTINIEDDTERTNALNSLSTTMNLTSNFDLCVFTQCGAGGYYGSFNINHMLYKTILTIVNKKLDPEFDFYFQMNYV